VTQNHYAEIHIFNLFIYMRVKKKIHDGFSPNIGTQIEEGIT